MSTVVSFHAHPDDEALLTGGWLSQRSADGDRVVLVFATDGAAGLAAGSLALGGDSLGRIRRTEAAASADVLGVARVVWLGYADSGMRNSPTTVLDRFVDTPVDTAARELAVLLDEEDADILTGYDSRGGYGHPDHVHVHEVARGAQALAARRPRLLEATIDAAWLLRGVRLVRPFARLLPGLTLPGHDAFVSRGELALALRVDVRAQVPVKRAALAAHASQTGGGVRTAALLLALPRLWARRILGNEWFLEVP